MNERERARFDMFIRVREFGLENAADFPAGSVGKTQFDKVAAIIPVVEAHAADQSSGTREARTGYLSKDTARENLREEVSEISATARAMEFSFPGISTTFRMPRSRSDADLLAAAQAFIEAIPQYEDDFIAYGLPLEFLTELTDAVTAFENSLAAPAAGINEQVAATAELGAAIKEGIQAVRVLDGVVRNKYRSNVGKLAAWLSASHTDRSPRPPVPPPGG